MHDVSNDANVTFVRADRELEQVVLRLDGDELEAGASLEDLAEAAEPHVVALVLERVVVLAGGPVGHQAGDHADDELARLDAAP